MKQDNEHTNLKAIDRQSIAFFAGGKFLWKRSKAEIWSVLEAEIEKRPTGRSRVRIISLSKWSVAASLLILLALGCFLRFFSVSVQPPAGQHTVALLPDQSKVDLNAQSKLTYYPLWWHVTRIVKLEGEGFFEVQKGKKFTIISLNGSTQVVGTSFNIFSRDQIYKVTCLTGSVKVKSKAGFEVILKPNSKAEIQPDGQINVLENIEAYPEISWKRNVFLFTASPAVMVFREIERQYGVHIKTKIDDYSLYTGNFTKDQNVEEILEYVCPALDLKYIRKSAREFLIIPKDE